MTRRFSTVLLTTLFAALLVACFPLTEEDAGTETPLTPTDTNVVADSTAGNVTWQTTAVPYRGDTNLRVTYDCPDSGSAAVVWGTDTYTDDSSVCTAAVHAGKITLAAGGRVIIEIRPGQTAYAASTRNGIVTYAYGTWLGSYIFP